MDALEAAEAEYDKAHPEEALGADYSCFHTLPYL